MVLLFFRSEHGQFQKCSCPYRISSMPQALIRKISYKRKLEDRGRDTWPWYCHYFVLYMNIYIYILGWRYLIFCDFRQCTHCCRYDFNSKKSANLARRAKGWAGLGIFCSIAHSLIRAFAHLLKSLRTNKQMWAICSGCSGQMSDWEHIAQVAHDKWANLSNSLRSIRTNEQMSE